MPCNHIDLLHIYPPMVMRGVTLTVTSLVTPLTLILHIYMPMVMRWVTLTAPSLVNPIDLLHIYKPMVMRGSTLTVPTCSLVNPINLLHNVHACGERVNLLRTFLLSLAGIHGNCTCLVNSRKFQIERKNFKKNKTVSLDKK